MERELSEVINVHEAAIHKPVMDGWTSSDAAVGKHTCGPQPHIYLKKRKKERCNAP